MGLSFALDQGLELDSSDRFSRLARRPDYNGMQQPPIVPGLSAQTRRQQPKPSGRDRPQPKACR